MKTRILSFCILVAMLICAVPTSVFAGNSEDIIILYENDVHCELEGYSALAAMKNELKQEYSHVGVVSSGDFLQGSSRGSVSKGEYVVRLMNMVGYDAIALGNHEFDYGLERLYELSEMLDTEPVCANFMKLGEGECFKPYSIVSYGDVRIAYIGITTPETPAKTSFPSQFVDDEGNPIYTFSADNLAAVVQENIDKARGEGADFVIALSHLGDEGEKYSAASVVSETTGLDAVLDAHSHSVIESETLVDKNGKEVLYTSTGTKFENIGKLTVSKDGITSELISLEEYDVTDPLVDACLADINEEYAEIGNRKIAYCEQDLITHDSEGGRIIRKNETNLGNLIADAFRKELDADISYINGGSIRSHINAGDVKFNDILNVLPYSNTGVVIEVSGATVVDMLETAVAKWPEESGNFPHVSGISFYVNFAPDATERVYNVKIEDPSSGEYVPIDLERTYTLASTNFILLEGGDEMTMFKNAKVLSDTGVLDVEILESYIVNELDGVIGEEYSEPTYHILFTEGVLIEYPYVTDGDHAIWIAGVAFALMVITIVTVIIIRKKRGL